jgi:hypothetical protein
MELDKIYIRTGLEYDMNNKFREDFIRHRISGKNSRSTCKKWRLL